MNCPNCNEENPLGSTNCQRCGVKLETRTCTSCGRPVRGKSRFCIHCGAGLMGGSPSPRSVSRKRSHSSPQSRKSPPPPPPPPVSYPPPVPPPPVSYPPPVPSYTPTPVQGGGDPYASPGFVQYSYGQPAERSQQTLRDKTILLKEQFGAVVKKGNYREVLADKNHPATQAFIDFIAWGVTHFYGFAALIGAITFLGIFLGGWGIVFGLALAFVYGTYKKEIDAKIREMKSEQLDVQTSSQQPGYRYVTASSRDFYYQISSQCNSCGHCVPFCPTRAIFQISQQFLIDQTRCNQCGDCEYQCPSRAILRVRD